MRKRIKDVVSLRNIKSEETNLPYIALENIKSWDATFVETNAMSEGVCNVFKKDDILFGKLRPYLAKGFIPEYDGICSSEFLVLKANDGMNNKYLLYTFLSHSLIDYISNQVAGVKMPRTNWDSFSGISIEVPDCIKQEKIVKYLDAQSVIYGHQISLLTKKRDCYLRLKTSIINRAVTRGLNPDVSFKDSGIEWIGKIPEHWSIRRFKETFTKNITGITPDSKNPENFEIDKGSPWITIADMTTKEVSRGQLNLSEKVIEEYNPPRTPKGSLLFSFKLSIGKMSFASNELYTNEAIMSLFPSSIYDLKFIYHLLPRVLKENSTENIYGAKMLNQKIISNMIMAFPPLSEQQAIAAYLDEKCAKIDAAIANIDKQIDALKRLKRALINEVVTGKREV